MKKYIFLTIALACCAGAANATTTTYTWHQTSASIPGLMFMGQYTVVDGAPLPHADSTMSAPDFGGLLSYQVSGGGLPPVTLADLVPACSGGPCILDFPDWSLDVPSLSFIDATDSFDYFIGLTSIRADTDAPGMCSTTGACVASGFWSAGSVPEPWSVLSLLGGIGALAGFRLRRA